MAKNQYSKLSDKSKQTIIDNANRWLKKNRTNLVSHVKIETREKFDDIHAQLKDAGKVSSREDTVVYLCDFWKKHEQLSD